MTQYVVDIGILYESKWTMIGPFKSKDAAWRWAQQHEMPVGTSVVPLMSPTKQTANELWKLWTPEEEESHE